MAEQSSQQTDSELVRAVRGAFAPGGVLSRNLGGFVARGGQREFAEAVARAIENRDTLVAEAGTGTGKTFAYLVPALLAGIRVMVSTAGKPLQDQLYAKDLPVILRALGLHANTVLLKGRSNYICLKRLSEVTALPTREDINYFRDIRIFADTSHDGDRSRLAHIPENDPIWPLVTSTKENCLGAKCPRHGECFLMRARKEAKAADILVVNHHLFLSSLAVAQEGGEEILPEMPLTVLDEAHQLPAIASDFFGDVFSTLAVLDFARDTLRVGATKAKDGAKWEKLTRAVDRSAKELADFAVSELGLGENDRKTVKDIPRFSEFADGFGKLGKALENLGEALAANAGRDDDLDLLLPRCENFRMQLDAWERIASGEMPPADQADSPHVHWVQVGRSSVRFCDTPLSFAAQFRALREQRGETWVFTSATLSVAGDFSHFLSEVGLPDAHCATWPSPFDFFSLAALYIPQGLPQPNAPGFSESVAESAWPFVRKAGGRTFFLCTSLRAVDAVSKRIGELAARDGEAVDVLRQGDGSRKGLLEKYRANPRSVLVGSMSFWEGIDIRGDALSVVVIDRIPFSPPDDPVLSAKCEWIRSKGGRPFLEQQVPEAVTMLRQGAGRLVRSENDRGVLILCDTRVISRWNVYGKTVVESLPDFCRTRRLERALAYLGTPGEGAGQKPGETASDTMGVSKPSPDPEQP